MKKNIGNSSAGTIIAGFVKKLWMLRQATARATEQKPRLMCAPSASAAREDAATSAISATPPAQAKPSASASPSQPVITSERIASSM